MKPEDQLRAALMRSLDASFASAMYTCTHTRRPDPDDQSLTVEKLYECILAMHTGLKWRVMRDGIPTLDPETGELCYYKLEAIPEIGTPEMWCASTDAAEMLIQGKP